MLCMLRIQRSGCATRRVFIKAGNRIRTGDLNLGKVALYQLSYARVSVTIYPAGPEKLRSRRGAATTLSKRSLRTTS